MIILHSQRFSSHFQRRVRTHSEHELLDFWKNHGSQVLLKEHPDALVEGRCFCFHEELSVYLILQLLPDLIILPTVDVLLSSDNRLVLHLPVLRLLLILHLPDLFDFSPDSVLLDILFTLALHCPNLQPRLRLRLPLLLAPFSRDRLSRSLVFLQLQ